MSQYNGDRQSSEPAAERLTALALNQLQGDERAAAEAQLAAGGESAEREFRELQAVATAFTSARAAEPLASPSAELRKAVEQRLGEVQLPPHRAPSWALVGVVSFASLSALVVFLMLPPLQSARESSQRMQASNNLRHLDVAPAEQRSATGSAQGHSILPDSYGSSLPDFDGQDRHGIIVQSDGTQRPGNPVRGDEQPLAMTAGTTVQLPAHAFTQPGAEASQPLQTAAHKTNVLDPLAAADPKKGDDLALVTPRIIVQEAPPGQLGIDSSRQPYRLSTTGDRAAQAASELAAAPTEARATAAEEKQIAELAVKLSVNELRTHVGETEVKAQLEKLLARNLTGEEVSHVRAYLTRSSEGPGTEQYERITENAFLSPRQQPLSTFSIDVDTASYANVRRFLTGGSLPPANAVRIEELVNYFKYDYPQPKPGEPFSVNMEVAECPWQTGHLLLRVGLKGKEVAKTERPNSNLVFLLDVSGSMQDENKLPLLKTAMNLLVGELGESDRVSIVTYAGEAGLRLAPTRGHERAKINAAIDSLSANGSTNGSAGINLAYEQAAAYFVQGGTNRVILCTDGDLNVGVTSDDALVELIKQKAAGGTFLTVLGFGEGNLKDAKLEKLADNGNGLYAYIDSVREARKVLVEQLTGSTITIAKDVKIQIEFNPAQVAAYRLLGYENRVLAAEDFANDKKDAGEIGAGHTVTALYELAPVGAAEERAPVQGEVPLKYQRVQGSGFRVQDGDSAGNQPPTTDHRLTDAAKSGELLTLKLRYKEPEGTESTLREYPLKDRGGSFNSASSDLQFAASVASFGMILRGSEHKGSGNLAAVQEIASGALGNDAGGYRAEFVDLVRKAQTLGAK